MKKYYKAEAYANRYAKQAGMTLIELTVVLLVLIGLAGLMIPYVSGFISKTHDSTGTFNSAAMDQNIQRYQAEKLGLPNNLESLVDITSDAIYTDMMSPGFLASTAITGVQTMSLAMAGITTVFPMDEATDNATFASTGTNAQATIAAGTFLATVAPLTTGGAAPNNYITALTIEEHMAAAFERDVNTFDSTCYDYVVMGIGDKSDLIGSTMSTAPVHFAQQGAMGPANRYNRFVAVFQVDKTNVPATPATPGGVASATETCSTSTTRAKFIGSAMSMGAMSGHLFGTSHSLAHTWENIAAN